MKNKFLLFSLLFVFGLLIFLVYPQTSSAAQLPGFADGEADIYTIEETTANASSTVMDSGVDANCGGVGFVFGTTTATYYGTSSDFKTGYTTSSAFGLELASSTTAGADNRAFTHSVLEAGTAYYLVAYATNTAGHTYATSEVSFMTKPVEPTGLTATETTPDSITLSWSAGAGMDETIVMYRSDQYPTSVTNGTEAFSESETSVEVTGLSDNQTYYFRAWSTTTGLGVSTSSDTYAEATIATEAYTTGGGVTRLPPTTFSDSLVINEGAGTTGTREVELSLNVSNASYMTICNDSSLLNCPLVTYATTKSWTLTEGDGEKTVYAKFLSPDGMNSDTISATITLELVAEEEVVEEEVAEEEVVEEEVAEEEVVEEEAVEEEVAEEEEAEAPTTAAAIRAKIAELQLQLIELLGQLLLLLQQQI